VSVESQRFAEPGILGISRELVRVDEDVLPVPELVLVVYLDLKDTHGH
jgi:hypothetical protein